MKKSKELRQKLGELTAQLRQILDDSENAGRPRLNAEDEARYSAIEADITALEKDITLVERQEERERKLAETVNPHSAGREGRTENRPGGDNSEGAAEPELRGLPEALAAQVRAMPQAVRAHIARRASADYLAAFRSYCLSGLAEMGAERRALQADVDIVGGYIVPPMQWINDLIKSIDDQVYIRGLATVHQVVSAAALGAPSLDADPADADWTSELKTGNEDSTMAFGKRELTPHPLAKRIKVSNKLMRLASIGPEGLVRDRLGYKTAITQEKAYMTGSGAQQPLGVFTASTDGIPTTRDVSTDNTTTAFTGDGLINALYSLKAAYMAKATWGFHRDGIKMARKLKDGNGQYLWQPGLQPGQPGTILERPFFMSEYAPNTFTTGLYVGIVGDFSYYWIADALSFAIQRLNELYAETNQTGFIGRYEGDAMPVLGEAFARVKLA